MGQHGQLSFPCLEDPIWIGSRILTKATTIWKQLTYPFCHCGSRISIHYTCELRRSIANKVHLADGVYLAPDVWLNIPPSDNVLSPVIEIGPNCAIGRRSTISARNRICLESDVLLAPSVLIMDHNHEYRNVQMPIQAQGTTDGGTILIEQNCWIGHGAVIVCGRGHLTVGRNSVIGANTVITKSVPPYTVIAGNPARVIRQFNELRREWVKIN